MSKHKKLAKRVSSEPSDGTEIKDTSPYVWQREKLRDPLKINQRFRFNEKQQRFVDTALDKGTKLLLCDGIWGSSKAQPLDAKILTPMGWKLMGELKIGDFVFGGDGKPTKILGLFPQGEKDIYRVTFSDGSSTECCLDHLWLTQTEHERNRMRRKRNGGNPIYTKAEIPPKVRNLKEIMETLHVSGDHLNHSIPITNPVEFETKTHHIDPYILGVLLGDGCLTQSVHFTSADSELASEISTLLPDHLKLNRLEEIEYNIIRANGGRGMYRPNSFKQELKRLDLWKRQSHDKFVPNDYLFDSIHNRLSVLQGLMDTDGTTNGVYTSFTTISMQLAQNVQFLIQSLGGTATCILRPGGSYIYKGERKIGKPSYCVSVKVPNDMCPFRLSRKRNKLKPRTKYFPIRYFESINFVGNKLAQCILVDNQNHLYLTDECIVTHNTYLSVYCALELLSQKKVDSIIYLRAPVEAGRGIGFLPGGFAEKVNPYAEPLFQKLHEMLDDTTVKMLEKDKRIEVVPPGFIRGQSWNCRAVIVDEAANFDRAMLELILSRIGPFCKVFVVGSHHQSDIKDPEGFMSVFEAFNDEESRQRGIHTFEFNDEADIVRSEFVKFVMRKLGVLTQIDKPIEVTSKTLEKPPKMGV